MRKDFKADNLFYHFIESADTLPKQADFFPYFCFMDQSIRKTFHQLRKTQKIHKNIGGFEELWGELDNEQRVKLYCSWAQLLKQALNPQTSSSSTALQDTMYTKKQTLTQALFVQWQKKQIKLTGTHFIIEGKKPKQYELESLEVRKSRNKEMFSFVLHDIMKSGRSVHCGFPTKQKFELWFMAVSNNINLKRVEHFREQIKLYVESPNNRKQGLEDNRENQHNNHNNHRSLIPRNITKKLGIFNRRQQKKNSKGKSNGGKDGVIEMGKSQTEKMIEKHLKEIDFDKEDDAVSEEVNSGRMRDFRIEDKIKEEECEDEREEGEEEEEGEEGEEGEEVGENQQNFEKQFYEDEEQQNPNIFQRILPHYKGLLTFSETPSNSSLLHSDDSFRLYDLPSYTNQEGEEQFSLKLFAVLPFSKKQIFKAISSEQIMKWNDDMDILQVKTNISSENSALIYERNKPQGILYRERDYLYLRHCFSVKNFKQKKNTFIIDKSIDSIHYPPFMTVVRAEKQLIWALIEKEDSQKQCIMIVEGWIKGGGYMNIVQNKQMTAKYMRKLMNLNGFLKMLSFTENVEQSRSDFLFKQLWDIEVLQCNGQEEEAFYTLRKVQNDGVDGKVDGKVEGEVKGEEQENLKKSTKEEQKKGQNLIENEVSLKKEKQEKEMEELMKIMREENQKSEDNMEISEIRQSGVQEELQTYTPPEFNPENKTVLIPYNYLTTKHSCQPTAKPKKAKYFPHFRGHHLWKGQWDILPSGGLAYVDEDKMKEQKKVLTYIIKRIGKNILSGKGILNISLPVDIFCVESNIQRIAMSFGFFPYYLEMAAKLHEPQKQLKYVIGSGMGSSLIYLTMEKPFNPILGETYQCWVDGCPIYFEQISHHPPIAAFMVKGRGYTVTGCVEAKMDLSINSGTGINEGVFTVSFDNGTKVYYTTAAGCLTGLTYGDRKLNLVGKSYYWTESGLFLEIAFGSKNKGGFFGGGNKGEGDEKLSDYIQGHLKQYNQKDLKNIAFKTDPNTNITKPIIPKSSPTTNPTKTLFKVHGRWNKYIMAGDEKIFDVNENRYFAITEQKNPLPSHSNYREDIVYRRMRNFLLSQQFKEVLEVRQRDDRKLRANKTGK